MLQRTIEEFGQRLGMPSLSLNDKGLAALDIDGSGRLSLEVTGAQDPKEMLVYLTTPIPPHDDNLIERALSFAHYKKPKPYVISTGVYNENLVITVRLAPQEITAQNLENTAIYLLDVRKTILEGGV